MQGKLKYLDATIKLFAPVTDLRTIRPLRQRRRNVLFGHGELSHAVLETLRDADRPLSSITIADQVLSARGIGAEAAEFTLVRHAIGAVLRGLAKSRQARVMGHEGSAKLWKRVVR